MPVGSMPYLTRSGRFSRTDRSSFLRNSGFRDDLVDSAFQDRKLFGNVPHGAIKLHGDKDFRDSQASARTRAPRAQGVADSRARCQSRQGGRSRRVRVRSTVQRSNSADPCQGSVRAMPNFGPTEILLALLTMLFLSAVLGDVHRLGLADLAFVNRSVDSPRASAGRPRRASLGGWNRFARFSQPMSA